MEKLEALPGVALLMLDLAITSIQTAEECETMDAAKKYLSEAVMAILEVTEQARGAVAEMEMHK